MVAQESLKLLDFVRIKMGQPFKGYKMQFESQAQLDNYNNNLVETNVRLMGDKTVVA